MFLIRRIIPKNFTKIQWFSTENHQKIVLSESKVSNEALTEAVKVAPELGHCRPEMWQRLHNLLIQEQNFPHDSFMSIVVCCPRLFTVSNSQLGTHLEAWRECQFGERRLQDLLVKHPELILHGDSKYLRERMNLMQSYVSTPKNVWKMFMSNPNLVVDPPRKIEEKLEYLMQTMKIEVPEISKTEALSHSLEHIKQRHIFLQRLGMFKVRTDKAIENNEKDNNPRLHQITDTSDKRFATKVCHVTLEEYEVFQELLKREWARESIHDEQEDFDEMQKERGIDQN